jgi:hypothetical protein
MRAAERGGWGEFPQWVFINFKTLKLSHHGISRRTTGVQKRVMTSSSSACNILTSYRNAGLNVGASLRCIR